MPRHDDRVYALIDAAVQEPEKARAMLEADPALRDYRCLNDETALHFSAVENLLDAVQLLAELGVDVNATNEFGDTALMDAVTMENEAMVALLLSLAANPDVRSECYESPLTSAAENGNEPLVEMLLTHGANPNYVAEAYFNPLARALDGGHDAIVRLLMQHGADAELLLKDFSQDWRESLAQIMEKG